MMNKYVCRYRMRGENKPMQKRVMARNGDSARNKLKRDLGIKYVIDDIRREY